jgi:hypothetical protein
MIEPPALQQKDTRQTNVVIWAVSATVVALVCAGLAIFFFLQTRPPSVSQAPSVPVSPFLNLPESAIPGRYKWISKSGNESFMTLNEDHTFTKDDNNPNPAHRWEITRDALVIGWLRSHNRLNKIERPGVYVEVKDGIEITRMEKQD